MIGTALQRLGTILERQPESMYLNLVHHHPHYDQLYSIGQVFKAGIAHLSLPRKWWAVVIMKLQLNLRVLLIFKYKLLWKSIPSQYCNINAIAFLDWKGAYALLGVSPYQDSATVWLL
jgi:hypothetical protein